MNLPNRYEYNPNKELYLLSKNTQFQDSVVLIIDVDPNYVVGVDTNPTSSFFRGSSAYNRPILNWAPLTKLQREIDEDYWSLTSELDPHIKRTLDYIHADKELLLNGKFIRRDCNLSRIGGNFVVENGLYRLAYLDEVERNQAILYLKQEQEDFLK